MASSSSFRIGKKLSSQQDQLLMCLELSAHDEALVSQDRKKLLPAAYSTCYAQVSSVEKLHIDSILAKHYGGDCALNANRHTYSSIDSCLARMSLSAYSHTTVWTLACKNERLFFCVVANDQLPFCALYAPTKGEYITFADGNLESARNYLVEHYELSEEEPVSAIVCSIGIKKEPTSEAKVSEEVKLEARVPVLEDTPPPPTAAVQEEAPAAPKKKVVRKRTAAAVAPVPIPPACGGGGEPETKKASVDESQK
jgi:hypothetical protein